MARNKGIKRLAFFIVFLIPVLWYLFLQLFGSNNFTLVVNQSLPSACESIDQVTILYRSDSIKASQQHYYNRIAYKTGNKNVAFLLDEISFFDCIQNDQDLLLVDREGIWGSYRMNREGVDQLLTELDILLLQKSYGRGVSR